VTEPDRFLITLEADGAGPPDVVRLRRWLKTGKRFYGLRAVKVEPALPPSGDELIPRGMVLEEEGPDGWRVGEAPTLGRCWDSLLTYPGDGDRLCVPTRPGHMREGDGQLETRAAG
jgi:hypothetical protein